MLEVTKSATDKIAEYFKDREAAPIRIFLSAGGCGLPSLALDLDEPNDTDNVFDIDGFQFIVDKEFMKEAEWYPLIEGENLDHVFVNTSSFL